MKLLNRWKLNQQVLKENTWVMEVEPAVNGADSCAGHLVTCVSVSKMKSPCQSDCIIMSRLCHAWLLNLPLPTTPWLSDSTGVKLLTPDRLFVQFLLNCGLKQTSLVFLKRISYVLMLMFSRNPSCACALVQTLSCSHCAALMETDMFSGGHMDAMLIIPSPVTREGPAFLLRGFFMVQFMLVLLQHTSRHQVALLNVGDVIWSTQSGGGMRWLWTS